MTAPREDAGPTKAQLDEAAADAGRQAARYALELKVADIDDVSLETKADMQLNRLANIVLKGGDAFLPTSLAEATTSARVWAAIAAGQTARRQGKIEDTGVGDADDKVNAAAEAAKMLRQARSKMKLEAVA